MGPLQCSNKFIVKDEEGDVWTTVETLGKMWRLVFVLGVALAAVRAAGITVASDVRTPHGRL